MGWCVRTDDAACPQKDPLRPARAASATIVAPIRAGPVAAPSSQRPPRGQVLAARPVPGNDTRRRGEPLPPAARAHRGTDAYMHVTVTPCECAPKPGASVTDDTTVTVPPDLSCARSAAVSV